MVVTATSSGTMSFMTPTTRGSSSMTLMEKRPNIIERNAIWNTGDHGIQAAADAIIRNNVIFDTRGEGIHCRNHQSAVVGDLTIVHNTILTGTPIRIVAPQRFTGKVVVANNALSNQPRIPSNAAITQIGNLTGISEKFPQHRLQVHRRG